MKSFFLSFFIAVLIFLPQFSHAAVSLTNPLGSNDVRVIAANLIQGFIGLTGIIALVMFIYGGVLWMTSAGKSDQVQKGKETLVWAVIGIIVIFSAFVVTRTVFEAILNTT